MCSKIYIYVKIEISTHVFNPDRFRNLYNFFFNGRRILHSLVHINIHQKQHHKVYHTHLKFGTAQFHTQHKFSRMFLRVHTDRNMFTRIFHIVHDMASDTPVWACSSHKFFGFFLPSMRIKIGLVLFTIFSNVMIIIS